MGIGKRMPMGRWAHGKSTNTANSGDMKGRRLYVKGTVNSVKRVLGNKALKIRASGDPGIVEIIHSDNRGKVRRLLIDAGLQLGFRGDRWAVLPARHSRPVVSWL